MVLFSFSLFYLIMTTSTVATKVTPVRYGLFQFEETQTAPDGIEEKLVINVAPVTMAVESIVAFNITGFVQGKPAFLLNAPLETIIIPENMWRTHVFKTGSGSIADKDNAPWFIIIFDQLGFGKDTETCFLAARIKGTTFGMTCASHFGANINLPSFLERNGITLEGSTIVRNFDTRIF